MEEEIDGDLDDIDFNNDEEIPLTKRKKKDLSNNNLKQKSSKKFKCQICKKDFDTIKKRSVHRSRAHVNLTCQEN